MGLAVRRFQAVKKIQFTFAERLHVVPPASGSREDLNCTP